ncbi:hypothetical protein XENOCAPTIV_004148 [Xenoophorus captivus]|uniref:Uncharacterized protein n=1 Tax=Xenoophorus captivus TaxID=1517983 RepID=A0ABV0QUS7_9TELE
MLYWLLSFTLQAAERDWEEKRASLTQYSAQDINRLLEETQAELMKAIPDLDFAAKQIKPSSNTSSAQNPQSGVSTTEHRSSKPQNKFSAKEGGSRRVPKLRIKSSHHPTRQQSLMEALRRGIETGDGVLTFQHADEVRIQHSNCDSKGGSSSQSRMTQEVRLSTYQRLDSLEETIRELENTLIEISSHPVTEKLYTETTTISIPAQRTGALMSESKRPPVPPKPASIQVHCLLLLCKSLALQ